MYGRSWIVPWEGMTLTKQESYKQGAIDVGVSRMQGLRLVTTQDDLMVRPIRAFADFGIGTVNEDEWEINLVAGLNAGAITVLARPANQIVVFFGIDDYEVNPVATLVYFRTALAGGTTKMLVDLQWLRGFTYCAGMLAEPVVYDPQQNIFVDIEAEGANLEYMVFMGYVIEPRGQVVS